MYVYMFLINGRPLLGSNMPLKPDFNYYAFDSVRAKKREPQNILEPFINMSWFYLRAWFQGCITSPKVLNHVPHSQFF